MSDMSVASALFDVGQGSSSGFSSREEAQLGVLREHGVTPDQYRKTIEWYGENLDKFDQVNKDVAKNLEKRIAKYDPEAQRKDEDFDNMWPYADHIFFKPGLITEGTVFSIPQPMIEKGGYAELKMKTSDPNNSMTVLLGVEYEDGTSSYTGRTASGFPQIKIRVQSDTARKVKRLYGYVHPTNELINTLLIDSISLTKLPYDSTEYYRISSQTNIK